MRGRRLAEVAATYLAESSRPYDALVRWIDGFVDFLVTKHGLAGALRDDVAALELMRGVGNLCIGAEDPRYDARRLVAMLVAGLRTS